MDKKLYVDSNRPIYYNYMDSDNWTEIKTVESFKKEIDISIDNRTLINTISFDYNLSDGNTIECVDYLIDKSIETGLPFPKIYVHSEEPNVYLKFENKCDDYRRKSNNQYILESRRKY